MKVQEIEEFYLIGLSLNDKTSNVNQQAMVDCGNLWQQFEKENIAAKIPNKLGEEIVAVYHDYDGDYTKPYAYFIGCKTEKGTSVPNGLDSLTIPKNSYYKIVAEGKMPDCVANAWIKIWNSDLPRAYTSDFEIYDEQSKDWSKAMVNIYLSIKP